MNGVWGTVCDDGWDSADAGLVCNQLGYYSFGAIPRYGASYGEGSGPIFISQLQCSGSESNILDCARDMYAVRHCKHYQDAGVECQGKYLYHSCKSQCNHLTEIIHKCDILPSTLVIQLS